MTKILIATEKPFAPAAIAQMRELTDDAGFQLDLLEKYDGQDALIAAVADANALIVRSDKITPEVLAAAPNLKIVVRAGAGYDNVNLEAATKQGVVVMNTPGQNANAVAELAFGMMIFQARGQFNGKPGTELLGKTLGIHAYGNVGQRVAAIGKGFGMDVYAFDPFKPAEMIEQDGIKDLKSAEDLYRKCQYVSLHVPANDDTINSIDYDLLKLMPENAALVNTARKEVIHEDDLMKTLQERKDFTYISDIAPAYRDEIEKRFPGQYYFTPKKMGAQTAEANLNAGVAAVNQIREYLKNNDATFCVNKEVLKK